MVTWGMIWNSDVGTRLVSTRSAAVIDGGWRNRFRGWASAGPAATTLLRRTPVPVHHDGCRSACGFAGDARRGRLFTFAKPAKCIEDRRRAQCVAGGLCKGRVDHG